MKKKIEKISADLFNSALTQDEMAALKGGEDSTGNSYSYAHAQTLVTPNGDTVSKTDRTGDPEIVYGPLIDKTIPAPQSPYPFIGQ